MERLERLGNRWVRWGQNTGDLARQARDVLPQGLKVFVAGERQIQPCERVVRWLPRKPSAQLDLLFALAWDHAHVP